MGRGVGIRKGWGLSLGYEGVGFEFGIRMRWGRNIGYERGRRIVYEKGLG